jgi:protocatechuate 3,4-dioxygenase beta subunit
MTTRPGMPCGYAFRVGTRYLISANRSQDDDQLYMLCGLIRPSDGSSRMVRYLESLSAPDAGGRVWGRIVMPSASRPAAPMAAMRVTISGPREMEATTDASGGFEFVALPPGLYSVGVTIPPNRPELSFRQHEISLEGAYACGEILLWPRIQSRVEGRIVDQTGAPIVGVDVTLESANEHPRGLQMTSTAATDDQGHYDFDGLFEGFYTARVRAEPDRNGLAPLTSEPIETQLTRQAALASGGHVMLEPIRLQRLVRISLEGRVVDASGAGQGGVALWVVALDDRARWSRRFVTDQDGRFSVPVYSGRRQQIIVGNRQEPRADVTIVAGSEAVVITVSRP